MMKTLIRYHIAGVLLLACALVISPARVEAGLAKPAGSVILKVTGEIENKNHQDAALFDRDMVEALGMERLVTATPWTEGKVEFEGIRGSRLLEALGRHGDNILARAINDYTVEIPVDDFEANDLFFALKMNGRYLRVRDKGPIWVLYPFSERADLNSNLYHNRSIWQLEQLDFK